MRDGARGQGPGHRQHRPVPPEPPRLRAAFLLWSARQFRTTAPHARGLSPPPRGPFLDVMETPPPHVTLAPLFPRRRRGGGAALTSGSCFRAGPLRFSRAGGRLPDAQPLRQLRGSLGPAPSAPPLQTEPGPCAPRGTGGPRCGAARVAASLRDPPATALCRRCARSFAPLPRSPPVISRWAGSRGSAVRWRARPFLSPEAAR